MEQKTINVFLASSGELKNERKSFRSFVSEIDETFQRMGRPLKTRMWEGLDASYKGHPEQDEYDRLIRASHMFLALFHTVGGEFTIHEFDILGGAWISQGLVKMDTNRICIGES